MDDVRQTTTDIRFMVTRFPGGHLRERLIVQSRMHKGVNKTGHVQIIVVCPDEANPLSSQSAKAKCRLTTLAGLNHY